MKKNWVNGFRKVHKEKILEWCKLHGNIPYFETSATKNDKIKDCFESLIKLTYQSSKISVEWDYINSK